MSGFFKRYQKAIIWVVVVSFFVGGVALVSLNQAGIFNSPNEADPSTVNIAVVNGDAILTEAVTRSAQTILSQKLSDYEQSGQDANELVSGAKGALFVLDVRAQALYQLIQQVLLSQAADERDIRVPRSEINEAFTREYNNLLESNSLTEEDLEQILAQQQQSLGGFKDSLRSGVEIQLRNAALSEQVVGVVVPTDEQLAEYLEANITRYDIAESVRASHILVADEALAVDLYEQLQAGADFAELAGQYSIDAGTRDQGGDLNWFERGMMVREFEDAAFALEIGEISEPVPSQYGFHVIQLNDRTPASVPALDDIKDQLRDDYIAETESERFVEWYEETYDASDIEITEPLLAAYLLQADDLDTSIAEFERLLATNEVGDSYFEYYIGRAYQDRVFELNAELFTLRALEEPTEDDLAQLEELTARVETYEGKALEHYLNALKEEAVDADDAFVNRVLALDPNSTDARYILGELYADRGDLMNAEAQFTAVIEESPGYVRAYIASGDLGVAIGEYEKAVLRFENALALNPPEASIRVAILIRLARAHMELGELSDAETYIQQTEGLDAGNAEIIIAQGDLAAAQLAEAVGERDALQAIAERNSEQELQLAEVLGRITVLEESATGYYESAIKRLGALLDLQLKLGQVYLLSGRLDEADDEFRMILARSAYSVEAYEGLAEVLIAQGNTEKALENLYSGYSRSFDDEEKERIAARILEFAPDDVAIRLQYADLLAQQYKWGAAISEYGAVLAAEPTQVDAYLGIAEAYRARQETSSALEYLRRGLDYATFDSQKENLYEDLIETMQILAGIGEPLTAEGLNTRIELARLYLSQAREARALEQLELVQADNPGFRLDEVNALIVQAGGTVELPPIDEPGDDASSNDDASSSDNAPSDNALSDNDASSDDDVSSNDEGTSDNTPDPVPNED
ncbi:peptidylprolyl isomerase [Candidatus Bipolaricaulota bacterium]